MDLHIMHETLEHKKGVMWTLVSAKMFDRGTKVYTYLPIFLPIYLSTFSSNKVRGKDDQRRLTRDKYERKGDDGDLSPLLVVLTDVITITRKQDSQSRAMFEYCMRR